MQHVETVVPRIKGNERMRSLTRTVGCLLLITGLGGCYQTPQQQLIGRWFNGEMSIRFEPDGRVVYSSELGLAHGRYQFEPGKISPQAQQGTPNLFVEVRQNGVRVPYAFEAVFIARDRLRLQDLTERPASRPSETVAQFALLRRAAETAAFGPGGAP